MVNKKHGKHNRKKCNLQETFYLRLSLSVWKNIWCVKYVYCIKHAYKFLLREQVGSAAILWRLHQCVSWCFFCNFLQTPVAFHRCIMGTNVTTSVTRHWPWVSDSLGKGMVLPKQNIDIVLVKTATLIQIIFRHCSVDCLPVYINVIIVFHQICRVPWNFFYLTLLNTKKLFNYISMQCFKYSLTVPLMFFFRRAHAWDTKEFS